MHLFFEAVYLFIRLLMRISMFFTKEKTHYLVAPEHILLNADRERICRIGHIFPSLIVCIIIGVKILPGWWPYYAMELEKNGSIISLAVFLIFIPVAILNGIIIEKILNRAHPKYLNFKRSQEESGNL